MFATVQPKTKHNAIRLRFWLDVVNIYKLKYCYVCHCIR